MRSKLVITLAVAQILALPFLAPFQAVAATNAQKALALATSGCQRGGFDTYKYESLSWIIIYSSLQHRINTSAGGTFEDTQIGLESIRHIEESWALSGTLDKKWSKLYSGYENALRNGLASWNKGESFGRSLNFGLVNNEAQINSVCKLANINSSSAAKKEKLTQKNWVLKTAGSLLPKTVKFQN